MRMCVSPNGRWLYALIGGTDTLLMIDADTGEWMMSAPVGQGPIDMRLDRTGHYLAVAGGSASNILLLEADTLCQRAEYPIEGTASGVFFVADGLVALSTAGEYNPVTQVGYIRPGSAGYECAWRLPGMAGSFAMAMNGLLVGHMNALTLLSLQHHEIQWTLHLQGLPDTLAPVGRLACYADRLTGRIGVVDCFQPSLMTVLRKQDPTGLAYAH
jgi:hypothetical protein